MGASEGRTGASQDGHASVPVVLCSVVSIRRSWRPVSRSTG
jgi:hypothetical protein